MPRALLAGLLAAALAGAAAPAPARAEPAAPASAKDKARAAELKQKGDKAMRSLAYADALAAYEEAYRISPDPALLYNRGRALQALERFPEALEQLEAFAAQAEPRLKARVPALDALLTEVRAKVSRLTVSSPVEGARVLLDRKVIGETPLPPLRVNAGSALIEVEAEGYHPFRQQIDLPGGGEASVTATLTPRSLTGVLVVRSPVAGATVVLDGRPIGVVPAEASVRAGTHTIRLARDGYEDASTTAILRAGERKEVSIPLERVTPLAARWWFWTGIGVAVVGGAVLTGALLTERSPSSGDIPPGQVSAPLLRY